MRNLFIALVAMVFSLSAQAQITTPAPSPACKTTQMVGMCEITLEYSRPSMRGRIIFAENGLVPFDQMWRTGANRNSMVTFSTDVMVGDQAVAAGTYAIFTIPGTDEWTIYLYTDTENWGNPESWDEGKVAATLTVPANTQATTIESMMFVVDYITMNSCNIVLAWDKTYVRIPVSMDTDAVVAASINKTLAGPTARDYYLAARYYLDADHEDMAQAAEWAAKSNEMDPKYWQLRVEALILGKMGNYNRAIEVAQSSIAMAKEAGNMQYVKMNNESIAEWSAKKDAKSGKVKSGSSKM